MLSPRFSTDHRKADRAMKLRVPTYMIAATALLGLALALSTGDALAGKPLVNTVKKGVNAVEGIAKGAAKGTRGAVDDIGQGIGRAADDLAEGAVKGADDLLEGVAEGADDAAAAAGKAVPPGADDAAGAPKYADAPVLDDADQVLKYDVVPDEAVDDIGNAADLPDPPTNVPGYVVAPDAPNVADDLAAAGDELGDAAAAADNLDAAPGNYLAPDSPLGIDADDVAPLKPSKLTKKPLPKLTKVAKAAPLGNVDEVADEGLQGVRMAAVKALGKLDPDIGAGAARRAAKAKAQKLRKIRNIQAGVATAVVTAAVGTTLVLYFTVEPVREDLDVAKGVVDQGFKTFGETLSGGAKKLTVNNVADGPVEIFKLTDDNTLETIGSINETPGSTILDVKKGDVIVIQLSGEQWDSFTMEDSREITVQ
jgi:hypothetical protein